MYQTILKQWLKPIISHNSLGWQDSAGCFFNFMWCQQGSLKEAAFSWQHVWVFGAIGCSVSVLLHTASYPVPQKKYCLIQASGLETSAGFQEPKWKLPEYYFCHIQLVKKSSPHKRMRNRPYEKEQHTHQRWAKLLVAISRDDPSHLFYEIQV